MEAGKPSPLKIQISQEGAYKPGFLWGCEETFRRNWWDSSRLRTRKQNRQQLHLQWKVSWSESAAPVRGR